MTDLLLSNEDLDAHRTSKKRVTNPGAHWKEKRGSYRQRNFRAETEDGKLYRIYLRQNMNDSKDFSCGLVWLHNQGKGLILVRYNGASHRHGSIAYRYHIHLTTAEAISAGRKPDSHAEETNRYRTLEGALACLIEDYGVRNLKAQHDQPDLFDET